MTTAADILENAAELTKRYGKTVTSEPTPARAHVERFIERLKGCEFTPDEAEAIIRELRTRVR